MSKSATASPTAEPPPAAETAPDENAIQAERLRRSVRVTSGLLRAVTDSRKLLTRLAAPFLEVGTENESEKKIGERKGRCRDAVFAAAKVALDPNYATTKFVDELLNSVDGLDAAIGSNARDVKAKMLEPLDELIKRAMQDANEEKSAESVEQFTGQIQALLTEMDARAPELATLRKTCKVQSRQAMIDRFTTTRNIVIAVVVLVVIVIGSIGYIARLRQQHRAVEAAAQAKAKGASPNKEAVAAHPEPAVVPAKPIPATVAEHPVPVAAAEHPVPAKSTESAPVPKPAQAAQSAAKIVDGTTTLSSGQTPEETKEGLRALSEAIRIWNAENDAQPVQKPAPGKASK